MIFPDIKNKNILSNQNSGKKYVSLFQIRKKIDFNIGNNSRNFDDIYEKENKKFIKKLFQKKKYELYKLDEIESITKNKFMNQKINSDYNSTKITNSCKNKLSDLLSFIIKNDYLKKEIPNENHYYVVNNKNQSSKKLTII